MTLHKGKILRAAIEESGVSVTRIVAKIKEKYKYIKCSRTRLYHLFKQQEVDDNLMLIVGKIIYYDFTKEIPDLAENSRILEVSDGQDLEYDREAKKELFLIRQSHAKLQTAYINLLSFLTKVANQNNDVELKREIERFLNRTDE